MVIDTDETDVSRKEELNMKNSYWNHKGMYQTEYDEMRKARHIFTNESQANLKQYNRFYGDGCIPQNMNGHSRAFIVNELETLLDETIKNEYTRFTKKEGDK